MINTKKIENTYDSTKKMLKTIRNIQKNTAPKPNVIREQYSGNETMDYSQPPSVGQELGDQGREEQQDYTVINDVPIEIHSEDSEDLELTDEEKGKISQLIDDFRAEVVETVEFDKLHIYDTSAKLDGKIGEFGLMFTLSTGDDTGLYINGQMLKIDEESLVVITKLATFELKFASTINDLLVRRRST